MSSEPPPDPITPNFNLSAWIQAVGSGLSLAVANTYFISKRVADTAVGLITFIGGISTNTITPYGTGEQSIFTDLTGLRTVSFGEGANRSKFGFQSANVELGTQADFNVKIGENMPSRSGNQIAIGCWPGQDTNIGIGTTNGGDIYSGTNKIIIGGAGNATAILSDSTLISGTGLTTNSIQPVLTTDVLTISSAAGEDRNVNILNGAYTGTQVKGNINIMTGSCASGTTGGTVAIQTNNTTGVCNIGNPNSRLTVACPLQVMTGNDSAGNVNVLSGAFTAGASAGTVSILSGSHNATATGGDINIHSGSCKGTMILGNSVSTLNLNAGTINLNKPLTVGYAPAAITALTQIGRNVENVFDIDITLGGGENNVATLNIGTAGVYIITYSFRIKGSGTVVSLCESWFNSSLQTGVNAQVQYGNQAYFSSSEALGSNIICQSGSAVLTVTSTSTITFKIFFSFSGTSPILENDFSYYSYTRLA